MHRIFAKSEKGPVDFPILRANGNTNSGKRRKDRVMRFQALEARHMLAAAIWHNAVHPVDVSGDPDSHVSPIDALLIINELNRTRFIEPGTGVLPRQISDNPNLYFDVDCDGKVAPIDALIVINYLNRGEPANGPAPGSGGVYSTSACAPEIRESDRFVSELTEFVRLPNDESAIRVLFETPEFDPTAQQSIRDAFEIEVTDEDGNAVSLPYSLPHDAVVNWTESFDPVVGPGTNVTTEMETGIHAANINLAGLAEGSLVYVTARLVNNDNDNLSRVLFRGIEIVDSEAPAPTGMSPASSFRSNATEIDFESLEDISGSVISTYGRTTLRGTDNELVTSLVVTNAGAQAVNGQLIVAMDQFSELDTFALRPDGFLPDGRPFFDLSSELTDGLLLPGDSVQSREFAFRNESGQRFQYRLTTYAKLNVAPSEFVSTPLANIEAGRTYQYVARATDPDEQPLTYTKIAGPELMVVDAESGEARWETTASDVGAHQVILRATDPFGLFVEQSFNVDVVASLQNRPPNFVSDPVTDAIASSGFEITTVATGAQPAGVDIISGFRGPRLVTINSGDQTVGIYAGENNDRFDDAAEFPTGQPKPTDVPFDVGYSVDVGFEPWTYNGNANQVHGLAQADFNSDGILDLAAFTYDFDSVTRIASYKFTVMIGDGNGQFAEPVIVGAFEGVGYPSPRNLISEDVNNDGHQDLIAVERANNQLYVILGNGDGTFEEMQTTTLEAAVSDFRMVDLNQDGNMDLVGRQNVNGWNLGWWAGNGDGTFGEFNFVDTASSAPGCCGSGQERPYDVADLNGDGLLDIVANDNRGEVRIYLANAVASFDDPVLINPEGPAFYYEGDWMRIADFTGDGHLDIAFIHVWHQTMELLVGDGSGVNFEQRTAIDNINSRADNYAGGDEIADIDGDGDLDIVLGSPFDNGSVQVLANDGDGNFTRHDYGSVDFPNNVGIYTEINRNLVVGAMVGDYNRDGVMDLAYMTQGQDVNGVGIRLGTRPGEFGRSRSFSLTQDRVDSEVHPGDYSGDGIIDLLSLRSTQMFLGNGDGTFADPFPAYNVSRPDAYGATADFNLDGLSDIVATRANTRGARYYVALSNGDGTLNVSDEQLVEGSFYGYSAVRIVDFNNDGYPDFMAKASVERHIDVHLNNPDAPGTFTRSFRTTTVDNGVNVSNYDWSFATGDFNSDGFIDIAYGDRVPGEDLKIVILAGDGQGGFTELTEVFAFDDDFLRYSFYYPGDLQAGDIDEDGSLDLVSFTPNGQRVIFGNGDGTFREAVDHYFIDPQGVRGRGLDSYLIDINGDDHLDIVEVTGQTTGLIRVRPGDGSGKFGAPLSVDVVQGAGLLTFADIDHDGKLDILHVGLGSGGGGTNMPDAVVYAGKRDGLVDVLATDLNNDGKEEVLAVNEDSDRLTIYVGDNLGGLTRQPDLLTGRAPRAVTVADLDGDASVELITASRAGRSLSVFSGSITAGYESRDFPAGNGVIDVEAADLDGDGSVDLVALDDSSQALLVFAGNGTRELSTPTAIPLGDKPGKLTLADTNGDGFIDATITLPDSNRLMILPGDGQLGFGMPIYVELTDSPSDVRVVDLNSDGNVDLVSTLPNANVVAISYGLGGNQYSRSQQIRVGEQPSRISLADADEDGRTDLIVSNRGDNTASVIYNRFDPNEVYRYDSDAIDPDDDQLTYSIVDGPGGLIINAETGQLLWAASPDQVGQHDVTISADDGRGGVATQSFKIDVQPARENASPLFATEPATTLGANETFTYQAQSLDNDNDAVRYRLLEGPDGATIDPTTGLLEWDGRGVGLRYAEARQGGDIRIPENETLQPESITIEQWFKLTDRDRYAFLIQTGRMQLRVNEFLTGIYLQIDFPDHNDQIRFTVPKQMELDRWYHIALTYDADSGEAIVYLDGEAIGSGTSATPQPLQFLPGNDFFVGNNNGTAARYLLDNYRMWDVARTADEIVEGLSNQQSNDPRLLVDYRFSDVQTRSVEDFSGNLNIGYLTGNTLAPRRVPGLTDPGLVSFTIAVEDGRGGFDQQSFTVNVLPELRGTITGTLFEDLNGDGLQNDGSEEGVEAEPGLEGWELFIDTNGNNYPDPHESKTLSNSDGNYVFDDLLPGTYPLKVTPVAGYQTPAMIDVEVAANQASLHDMAIEQLALSQIQGQLRTEDGDAIAYWKAFADLNDNGELDDAEPMAMSDRAGNYAISGLAAGTYKIRTQRPAGWIDDSEGQGLAVQLAVDEISRGHDFVLSPTNTSVTAGIHFVTSPTTDIEARQTFRYASVALGITDDTITYDLSLAPEGMTIDPATGLVAWRPTLAQTGEQLVILRATSSSGSIALQDFTLNVTAPNTAPAFSSTPSLSAYATLKYAYTIEAQDAEGDPLSYNILGAPAGVTLDAETGELLWTPTAAQVGEHNFELSVVDAAGNETRTSFRVVVSIDQPVATPYRITNPRTAVGLGQDYFAQIEGVDQLGRELTWSLTVGPSGMSAASDGTIRWRPTNADLGEQLVELEVTDADGGSEMYELTLQVVGRPVNTAPKITSTPLLSAVLGSAYTYDLRFEDADADVVAFSLIQGPANMSVHPSLGTLRWVPAEDQLGQHDVEVQVADPDGTIATQAFTLKVSRAGGPPRITSVAATEAAVGAGYLYTVVAQDREGDPLTYRLLAAPAGMTITGTTGEITWTPAIGQTGQQDVVIEVSDGVGGAATQAFAIRVSDGVPNLPPTITSTAPRFGAIGETYRYTVAAVDPEATTITYSLGQAPDGMTIDGGTGLIEWTPAVGQAGQFILTIVATDAGGATAVESFQLDVLTQNSAPVINSEVPTEAVVGAEFTYQVLAIDSDRDPLTFELVTAPASAIIDPFGKIAWMPDTVGTFDFVVRVTDPRGGEATQSFSIEVVADAVPPVVSIVERPESTSRNVLPWQGPYIVYVRGIDNVEVASLTLSANGQDIRLDASGTATFTFEDWTFQQINATATAIDTSGNVTTRTITFGYDFPEGWSGAGTQDIPTAIISSPTEAAAVFGMVSISGTADHADFDSYRLSYRRADESTYTEFHSSRTAVTNSELGVWDTSLLLNDEYFIRLEVATAGGIVNVAEHSVGLSGNLKLGDFQLEFTDLIVPIANAQIAFTRVYDTLQSDNQGDFGYGWRLEYRDTDLHVGLPESGLEDIGIYSGLRPGVKVYLNIPGEGRIGFTFDPDIRVLPGWGGNNLVLARPRFTADRGVNATLSTGIGNYLHVNEFGELMAPGGIPYNPASPSFGGAYVVKTSDGTSYRIDGESGELLNIQDSAGNMVSFADDGIYDGQRRVLSFVRDAAGRITQVLDPIGGNIQYRYSTAGDLIGVTDRAGNESSYTYDDTRPHFLKDYVDPNNQRVVRNEYSDDGRLIRQFDASGESTAISYDIGNRLVIVTDELGYDTGLEYDNRGLLVAQTDALGNTTRREYDENGNQIRLTDATGAETRSTFNQFGSQTSLTDALGNVTRWTYDQFGNTLTEVSPTGLRTSATFDDRGLQTSMTNASGGQTQFTLNAFGETETVGLPTYTSMQFGYENGLPVSITDSDDADVKISYDDLNQPTRIADLNSGTSFDVEYDANGNLTSVTDVFGAVITYEYDANGNVIATEDALGNRTTYQYDRAGRLIQTTYADGLYESNEYDVAGRLVQKRDRAGHETRYVYDAVGRVVTIVEPDLTPNDPTDNPRINYEYDAVGRMTASVNQLGARIEYQYDPIGNLIRIIDPMGGETIRRYDGESRLVETIDPVERSTRYGYDASGNQESLELNDGSIFITEHDRNGLPLRAIDAAGVTKHFQYGQYGRLLAVVEAHGEWTYSYDHAGFLASTTDPLGNTTSFVNDAMGRIVEKTFPDGRTESYAYDLAGNLISRTQPDGGKITFDYDQLNRQTAVQYPDGSTIVTVYTANGLIQAVEQADVRTTFQYDALSRETSRIDPNGFVVSTEYDLAGNKISTTSLAGATIYDYDANNRLISVEFGEDTTRYYYNAAGDLRRSEYSNGVYETLSWSDAGRIREKSVFDSTDQLLEQLTYAYDAAGRILSTSYLDDKVQTFEYNDSGWLVTETTMVGMSEESRVEHRYDANGNRINHIDSASGVREFEYDNLNRIIRENTEGIVILYEYDSNGNLTSKTSSNGDQSTYQWDKAGRLLSVTMIVGETSNTVSYEYSPDGELMSRTVNGVTVHLIVDTAREFPQTLAEITESDTIETAYVLPAYDRGVIAQYQDAGQQVLHSDAGYSTIVVTDTSGSVSDRISYSGYGEVSNRDGTSNIKHLYNGELRDNITGLDYLRARNYDPNTGRFISADPFPGLTVDPITMNSYAYASADPINHTDPSGNVSVFEMKVVLGINMTLFGIGGAALGYKIAEYKEVNPIAGAIIGGITGAAVGFGATVGIAFTITSGGVTALEATAPLLTAEVLVPIALIDVSSALVLLMSTFGLLSIAEVAKTYGVFQSLLDQSGTVPGSNVPLSSLTPQAIVEVREPGGNE